MTGTPVPTGAARPEPGQRSPVDQPPRREVVQERDDVALHLLPRGVEDLRHFGDNLADGERPVAALEDRRRDRSQRVGLALVGVDGDAAEIVQDSEVDCRPLDRPPSCLDYVHLWPGPPALHAGTATRPTAP